MRWYGIAWPWPPLGFWTWTLSNVPIYLHTTYATVPLCATHVSTPLQSESYNLSVFPKRRARISSLPDLAENETCKPDENRNS
ncbi:hypothetical protein B0H14DRAFT_2872893, partial [Mycena olivaceomarginata]